MSAWLPVWLPAVVTSSICSNCVYLQSAHYHLGTKNDLSEPPTCCRRKQRSKCWKLDIFSQDSATALCGWGRQIHNFLLHIFSVYSAKYCRNWSSYVDTTVKWTVDCFFLTRAVYCRNYWQCDLLLWPHTLQWGTLAPDHCGMMFWYVCFILWALLTSCLIYARAHS